MRSLLLISLVLILLTFGGCSDNTVYSKFHSTNNGKWEMEQAMRFEFTAPDTTSAYDLFLNLRNDNSYPYSNLFLIAGITFPSGIELRDTLEYEMAAADGTWLGHGYGSVKENKLWFKEKIVFPENGVYILHVSHAMREVGNEDGLMTLNGITDVGLEIEKSE